MFSKSYFNQKVERFTQTKEEFNACLKRKDFVAANERLIEMYDMIESMRATARCSAYEELDFESYDYAMQETALCESIFKQSFKTLTKAVINNFNK